MAGENVQQHFLKDLVTGDYICKFCRKKYAKGTTSTRLRGHLTGEAKTGATRCLHVPQPVRDSLSTESSRTHKTATSYIPPPTNLPSEEAEGVTEATAMLLDNHVMREFSTHLPIGAVMPPNETSSNPHQIVSGANNHYFPSFSPERNNDFGNDGELFQNMKSTQNPSPDNLSSFAHLYDNFGDDRGVQSGPKFALEGPVRDEVMTDEVDQNIVQNCEGSVHMEVTRAEASSFQSTQGEGVVQSTNKRQRSTPDALPIVAWLEVPMVEGIQDTDESAPHSKRPVGEAFKRNEEKTWSWLMDDQVLRVGIYGMGGVGKTTLMRHIQTRLEGQSCFEVYWITVSQDFSILKLQNLIGKEIGLNFSYEEDEVKRAKRLAEAMQERKCILILDDLWNYFDADEVGIPVGVNLCKLVLTTRLLQVCRQMECIESNTIQLQGLSREESWILFTQELGNYNIEVEELAEAVCMECAGLPLGIRVMARSMKRVCNVRTWRSTLEDLKESKVSKGHEMQEEVFCVLKFSYLRLKDPILQECLSYCALFPEDERLDRNNLVDYMIDEGIIDAKKTRQAELDKGHTMVDTLENACLLEGDSTHVWMHDLVRDMMILELREGSKTLVEAGAQLTELPDEEKWSENLVRVSLMGNAIKDMPADHTPKCPNLSTLLLCRNSALETIADSFFEKFQKLKILDLSKCCQIQELPRSISDLMNLTALLIRDCSRLIHVPSLAKLEKLKKLDLNCCSELKQMPDGMRFLLKLKYLDLSSTRIEEEIRSGTIRRLHRLQVLKLCDKWGGHSKFSMRGSEVGELRMLETLRCSFSNGGEFGEYMQSRERSQQSLTDYSIFVGSYLPLPDQENMRSKKFVSVTCDNFNVPLELPADIEALTIAFGSSTLYKALFPPSLLSSLVNLREIGVYNGDDIEDIFAMNEGEDGEWRFPFSCYSIHSISNHSLLNLAILDIRHCHKLKKLFPVSLLPNLHNLQEIQVRVCCEMEEIFSTDHQEEEEILRGQPNLIGLYLPRLIVLILRDLPELRSIYKGAIICHSLQKIQLFSCPELKRITIPLPQPSLQKIQAYPTDWWDSVHWGSANQKNHLESHSGFKGYWRSRW